MDYFQDALQTFNGGNWYGWKTHDDDGNKIPNKDRMKEQQRKIRKYLSTRPIGSWVKSNIQR